MRFAVVIMMLATLSWAVSGTVVEIALGIAGIKLFVLLLSSGGIVLPKLAALGKRSVHDPAREAEENLLLSTVSQLDKSGCVLKLLCLLEAKAAAARTEEEKAVVDVFTNQTDSVTSYNAPFILAADLGAKSHEAAVCNKYFSKCSLNEAKLSSFLQQAWKCDLDL